MEFNMKKDIKSVIVAAALLLPFAAGAQNVTANEYIKAGSLWYNSQNSAGFAFAPLTNFNEVKVGYDYNKGDYKRQQQGDKESTINFNTNGAYNLGGFQLWGNFDYSNSTVNDARFNTMLYNPLRDMPYVVADSVYSKIKRQSYIFNFKGSSPVLWDFVSFGLNADYVAQTSAKQKDPRSTDYYYHIYVNPSVLFRLGSESNHFVGLNFNYKNSFERTAPTNSDSQTDQPIYIMKGLGYYTPGAVGGIGGINTFFYKGNSFGGGLQYAYMGGVEVMAEANYHYLVENAYQTPSKPEKMGSVKQNYYEGKVQMLYKGDNTHKVTASYFDKSSDGIEYVQVFDRSEDVQNWITLAKFVKSNYHLQKAAVNYDFFAPMQEKGYSWHAGAFVNYTKQDDEYYLPNTVLQAENIYFNVFAKKNFKLCKSSFLLAGLDFGYNSNLSGKWEFGGPEPNSVLIREWFNKDYAYLTSNYFTVGAAVNYSTAISSKMQLFVDAKAKYCKPSEDTFSDRWAMTFAVGIAF